MKFDNGPRLLQNVDSSQNIPLLRGTFTKRMHITKEDSPIRDYMESKIDLTHPTVPEKILIDD